MNVLETIADDRDVDVANLETPLYTEIDTDALDDLLTHGSDIAITFEYEGQAVTVEADGTASVAAGPGGGAME